MDLLTADMECFYDSDYTLSRMSTEAYLRDSRFEEILWGLKWNDTATFWLLPERADHFFKHEIDWQNTTLLCHHSQFDGARLNWGHGCRPALHIDTLSMARICDGSKAGNSLHDLCLRHNLGAKGDYVTFAKGKHRGDFDGHEIRAYGEYCCNDVDRTYDLAQLFLAQLPESEIRLIDLTIRLFTEPVFRGDSAKLRAAVVTEKARKIALLQRIGQLCSACSGTGQYADLVSVSGATPSRCLACEGTGVNKKIIGSSKKFAGLLRSFGIEPETKPSPTHPNKQIYAFARTDGAMQSLLEDGDEDVRFLAEARIAVKSNIIETRAEKFAACAERGSMPVYLNHAGTHTLRPSGGDGMNWLNMSKHNAKRPELMVLRQSIQAPPGCKIVAPDSGQGEARITAWLAGQQDLVEAFAQGRDVYSEHASTVYGRLVDRKRVKEDHIPGHVGKVSVLGMGFGMGWFKAAGELLKGMLGAPPIQFTATDMETLSVEPSRFLNTPAKIRRVSAMPSRLELNDRLVHCIVTEALVQRYRQRYTHIVAYWGLMDRVITAMLTGEEITFGAHGVFRTEKDALVFIPNGLKLHYRGIERNADGDASYFDGRTRTKIHGPLLTENHVQFLHRMIVSEQMLKIAEAGIKIALWPYDEVVAVVPNEAAEVALEFMIQTMKETPAWAVGLPLTAEGKIGNTYAEC